MNLVKGALHTCMWLLVSLQAEYERRLLQLCNEGCKADISQFRQLLRQGVDVNVYDEVCIQMHLYAPSTLDCADIFFFFVLSLTLSAYVRVTVIIESVCVCVRVCVSVCDSYHTN